MKVKSIIFLAAALIAGCSPKIEDGVSYELAQSRTENISDVKYALQFDIPGDKAQDVNASETITFNLKRKQNVQLDIKGPEINRVTINGAAEAKTANEHLILPRKTTRKGCNTIEIDFIAGNQSLNRRDEFLYTLLVPDRARTLFPCFDQPDLKARYTLTLTVPEDWTAVSNSAECNASRVSNKKQITFRQTEPLSTYLFSFVAGKFSKETDGKISMYHRETDPSKISQCKEILETVEWSIDWLENYTGIKYPFSKYDLIAIPDFQYGGMEHTGATLYNDKRMFLSNNPTTDEVIARQSVITHETAHMWFGDLVTMPWFNEVWTKEVFANFFAAKMLKDLHPELDTRLQDMKDYYAGAYSEDRTKGAAAIERPLDNLQNAGLIYSNTIYDKSPVVMSYLEQRVGADRFQKGIHEYLTRHFYGNAGWDGFIESISEPGLEEWSRAWVKEPGMPEYRYKIDDRKATFTQADPLHAGNIWPAEVTVLLRAADGAECTQTAVFQADSPRAELTAPFPIAQVFPNADGQAYGRFLLRDGDCRWLQHQFSTFEEPVVRMSALMALYEAAWHEDMPAPAFMEFCIHALRAEDNTLIRSSLLSYLGKIMDWNGGYEPAEDFLYKTARNASLEAEFRLLALRTLYKCGRLYSENLLSIWEHGLQGMPLSEYDYTELAYQLMLRYPDQALDIKAKQLERISNPDRREAFDYVSRACISSCRASFFNSLLDPATRGPEARVTKALSILCSPALGPEALARIRPALDALPVVQRTGDIFFPMTWCNSVLSGWSSPEAGAIVSEYLKDNPSLNPLLKTKVLQAAGRLL